MVTTVLIEQYIQAGRELVDLLRHAEFELQGAFWLYSSESDGWRLVLVSNLVDSSGTSEAYRRLQELLGPDSVLSLLDVQVIGSDHVLASVPSRVHPRGPKTWMLQFSGPTPGGGYVDDAFIYQLP